MFQPSMKGLRVWHMTTTALVGSLALHPLVLKLAVSVASPAAGAGASPGAEALA